MTEDKITILFEQLKLTDEEKSHFQGLSLEKVLVNPKNNCWTFLLGSEEILPVEDYQLLKEKGEKAFEHIKQVFFKINPHHPSLDYLPNYYKQALNEVKDVLIFAPAFEENLIEQDGEYKIEVTNSEEEREVHTFLPKLNYLLSLAGFPHELTTCLNEEKKN